MEINLTLDDDLIFSIVTGVSESNVSEVMTSLADDLLSVFFEGRKEPILSSRLLSATSMKDASSVYNMHRDGHTITIQQLGPLNLNTDRMSTRIHYYYN